MEVYATKQEENCRAERGVGGGVQQNNLESCRAIVYIGRVLIPQYIIFTLFLIPSSSVNLYSRYLYLLGRIELKPRSHAIFINYEDLVPNHPAP